MRQDRVVDEVTASVSDLRRICDLFGVTIATAQYYTSVLSNPAQATAAMVLPLTTQLTTTGSPSVR